MHIDVYGQIIFNENDLCDLIMQDQNNMLKKCLTTYDISRLNNLENVPKFIAYHNDELTIDQFDKQAQANWHMPDEYKNLDIAKWVIEQCNTEQELERVKHELLLFLERDLFALLQYLKYLVDTLRQHDIVWGVGRGSSVASYVLYLIGVHKINSIQYQLDITDFLH